MILLLNKFSHFSKIYQLQIDRKFNKEFTENAKVHLGLKMVGPQQGLSDKILIAFSGMIYQ